MKKNHIGRPRGSKDRISQPKRFVILNKPSSGGRLTVFTEGASYARHADEVSLLSIPVIVHVGPDGVMRVTGEGVVKKHGTTIAVTG